MTRNSVRIPDFNLNYRKIAPKTGHVWDFQTERINKNPIAQVELWRPVQ